MQALNWVGDVQKGQKIKILRIFALKERLSPRHRTDKVRIIMSDPRILFALGPGSSQDSSGLLLFQRLFFSSFFALVAGELGLGTAEVVPALLVACSHLHHPIAHSILGRVASLADDLDVTRNVWTQPIQFG